MKHKGQYAKLEQKKITKEKKKKKSKKQKQNSRAKCQTRTKRTQILTRHRTHGIFPAKKNLHILVSLFPNPITMLTHMNILDPALYLCCVLVWSCLGKTISSASKQLNKRKWAAYSKGNIVPQWKLIICPACNADSPDSVVFSLSIVTGREKEMQNEKKNEIRKTLEIALFPWESGNDAIKEYQTKESMDMIYPKY